MIGPNEKFTIQKHNQIGEGKKVTKMAKTMVLKIEMQTRDKQLKLFLGEKDTFGSYLME